MHAPHLAPGAETSVGAAAATRPASRRAAIIVIAVMCAAAALLWEAARGDSVTIDEFAHLPAGLYHLHTGRFNIFEGHPPLLRMWCALPAWWAGAEGDFASFVAQPNHWLLGYHFMAGNASRYHALFVLGRLSTIVWVLALIAAVFLAGRRAFGPAGGVAAAVLCAFCPNILAHGHLVTTDAGHTLFFLLAVLAYARALRRLTMTDTLLAGVVLGLAQLTKFTALILYPIAAVLTLVAGRMRPRPWMVFAGSAAISLLVLNAGYLFSGFGTSLAALQFETPQMQALAASPLGHVPLPLPANFITGYDQQMAEARGVYTVFFHGQLARTGWWYYYLAAFLLKTPLPVLLLLLAGAVVWLWRGGFRAQPLLSATLFVPPLFYLLLYSTLTDVNLGLRYILPIYPFVFLIAASLWAAPWAAPRWAQALLGLALAAQVGTALVSRPYYLAYFNALAGGSQNGYRWLIDSNVDWGQELLRLRAYMQEHDITQVQLAYFGRVAPEVYGIDYQVIRGALTPGVYVVSATYLMGRPYYLYDHGEMYWAPQNLFALFQHYSPTATIGHSLFVFDLR